MGQDQQLYLWHMRISHSGYDYFTGKLADKINPKLPPEFDGSLKVVSLGEICLWFSLIAADSAQNAVGGIVQFKAR